MGIIWGLLNFTWGLLFLFPYSCVCLSLLIFRIMSGIVAWIIMETPPKRLKLIVTDVEPTGDIHSLIDIKLEKGLKPCARALLTKNLTSIVHSRTITNSDQRLKLTVSDVQFSNLNDVAWRTSRPSSIVDVEVDQGLEPLARNRVKSILARLREFYVVGPVDNNNMINNVVAPPPGHPLMGSALKWALVITVLICCIAVIMRYSFHTKSPSPSLSPSTSPPVDVNETQKEFEEKALPFWVFAIPFMVMNCLGPSISFPTWLLLYGFKFAAAAISNNHNDKDLISQLSDDLLISIINRLPTKDAVRTSILSNRWRDLYKFTPDIDLSSECLVTSTLDQNSFVNAVYRFLRLRSGSKICSLDLTYYLAELHSDDQYEPFVYFLGRLLPGIERLSLHSSAACSELSFSCHLISQIPSLTYLSLRCCSLRRAFDHVLTQSNSLQDLRLISVTVRTGALECILANCLSLHSLSMDLCEVPSKLIFRGPNLKLKSLCVRSCAGVAVIEVCASNLATFEFENTEMVTLRFGNVPKLESVFIDFENKVTMLYLCIKLVSVLPRMKSLIIGTKGIYQVISSQSMGINKCNNLTQLSMHLHSTKRVNLLSLAPFLESCPLLQEFHLDTEFVEYIDGQDVTRPPAAFQELKKVEITGHSGTKHEIEFALYILKSAINLEQMQISKCSKRYSGHGSWYSGDEPPWSNRTSKMIHRQLQRQAISQNARLNIQHSSVSLHRRSLFNIVDG
ncbi:hypothetical protein CASFOL_016260 [Castilleja foliolosa]|uniref:F-box domain-containing protein n=1 Tax=Castilleja foliolosa TaxID=1961234 RepID=A0ABD3DGW4_9LAMI